MEGLLRLPDAAGPLEVEVDLRAGIETESLHGGGTRVVWFAPVTARHGVTIEGTIDDYVPPVFDPALDRLVGDSLTWRFEIRGRSAWIVATLGGAADRADEIGTWASARVVRDGVVVLRGTSRLHVASEAGLEAEFKVPAEVVSILPEVSPFAPRDEYSWSLGVAVDPVRMLVERSGERYWPGTVEVSMDWRVALQDAEARNDRLVGATPFRRMFAEVRAAARGGDGSGSP